MASTDAALLVVLGCCACARPTVVGVGTTDPDSAKMSATALSTGCAPTEVKILAHHGLTSWTATCREKTYACEGGSDAKCTELHTTRPSPSGTAAAPTPAPTR